MLASLLILADGVTIQIGHNTWSFGLNFILYLVIAAIVGLIAEYIVGWRLPLGIIGAVIAALAGIWLMTQVISLPEWVIGSCSASPSFGRWSGPFSLQLYGIS